MSDEFRSILVDDGPASRSAFLRAMAHAKAMLDNGETVLLTVGPSKEPISVGLRRFYKGIVLPQIAEKATVNGERYVASAWAELFRRMFCGADGWRWEMQRLPGAKKATPVRRRVSTEELGVREYRDLAEKVIAYAVDELSIELEFRDEDRVLIRRAKAAPPEEKEPHEED